MFPFWKFNFPKVQLNYQKRKYILQYSKKMFTQDDVNILQKELPTSAVMEISKKTGISRPTIYRFLNGDRIRSRLQERIYVAALKIIERDKIKTNKIKQERSRILNEQYD